LEDAVELREDMAALRPGSPVSQYAAGLALLAADQVEEGIARIQSALAIDPGFELADQFLVALHLRRGETDEALAQAEDYARRHPNTASALNTLADVYLARSETGLAKEALLRAKQADSQDVRAGLTLAGLALEEKDLDQARQEYQRVLTVDQQNLEAIKGMAAVEGYAGNKSKLEDWLIRGLETRPESVSTRVQLANYYALSGKTASALSVLEEAPEDARRDPLMLSALGSAYLQTGSAEKAAQVLQDLVLLTPDSAEAHYLLSRALGQLGDSEGLERTLERVLQRAPGHLWARYDLVRVLLSQGDVREAELAFKPLAEALPDNADVKFLAGVFAALKDDREDAKDLLRQVLDNKPSSRTLLLLAAQEARSGYADKAAGMLEQWVRENPEDTKVRLSLADLYTAGGRVADAIIQYQAALDLDEDNAIALNNLAWHLKDSSPEEALAYAERAVELAPDRLDFYDTLANLQLINRDLRGALATLERALLLFPGNRSLQYLSGLVLSERGDVSRAIESLRAALRGDAAFENREDAQQLLARLLAEQADRDESSGRE
jgi:putative PEP-CTERM system TPR-repeat lipoprotein